MGAARRRRRLGMLVGATLRARCALDRPPVVRGARGRRSAPGPQLVWGPNAAGKTSLLEAMVVLARGGSHRTTTDAELIRWGADVARIEGRSGGDDDRGRARPARVRGGRRGRAEADPGQRRGAAGGGARRAAPRRPVRARGHAPRRRVAVAPAGRRSTSSPRRCCPGYAAELATYGRALQQRNGLLRAIREETGGARGAALLGPAVPRRRRRGRRGDGTRSSTRLAAPARRRARARSRRRRAPPARSGSSTSRTRPRRPARPPRDALARRLAETAEKEVWNGTTLIGPHRDDVAFVMSRPRPRRSRRVASSGPRSSR